MAAPRLQSPPGIGLHERWGRGRWVATLMQLHVRAPTSLSSFLTQRTLKALCSATLPPHGFHEKQEQRKPAHHKIFQPSRGPPAQHTCPRALPACRHRLSSPPAAATAPCCGAGPAAPPLGRLQGAGARAKGCLDRGSRRAATTPSGLDGRSRLLCRRQNASWQQATQSRSEHPQTLSVPACRHKHAQLHCTSSPGRLTQLAVGTCSHAHQRPLRTHVSRFPCQLRGYKDKESRRKQVGRCDSHVCGPLAGTLKDASVPNKVEQQASHTALV